jgi:hypothetical protein
MTEGLGPSYQPWQPTDFSMQYQAPQLPDYLASSGSMLNSPGGPTNSYGGSAQSSGIPYREAFGGYGATPQAGGWKGMSGTQKMSAIGEGASAFATLGQLYLGFKAMGAQKKQFKFQKAAWNKNFAASLKAYDNQVLDNYNKYAQGNQYFGNAYDDKETYTGARSLSPITG